MSQTTLEYMPIMFFLHCSPGLHIKVNVQTVMKILKISHLQKDLNTDYIKYLNEPLSIFLFPNYGVNICFPLPTSSALYIMIKLYFPPGLQISFPFKSVHLLCEPNDSKQLHRALNLSLFAYKWRLPGLICITQAGLVWEIHFP